MSYNAHAQHILGYACMMIEAAIPPESEAQPDIPCAEKSKHAQEMVAAMRYEDTQITLVIRDAESPDGRPTTEVTIALRDERGQLGEPVFIASSLDDEDAPVAVHLCQPGAWCEHLALVARRAVAVLQGRGRPTPPETSPGGVR